jgi:hypothetical protein
MLLCLKIPTGFSYSQVSSAIKTSFIRWYCDISVTLPLANMHRVSVECLTNTPLPFMGLPFFVDFIHITFALYL